MTGKQTLFYFLSLFICMWITAIGQDAENVRLIGRWSYGPCWAVAIVDDYAYIGNGATMQILDISDPENLTVVGETNVPETIRDITISNSYAYIADFRFGLRIIDISAPTQPSEIGYFDMAIEAYAVAVNGNYVYLADGEAGLRIINVSNPSNPSQEGIFDTPNKAMGVVVRDNYAYVADSHGGLRIINISNPTAPYEEGYQSISGYIQGVAINGNYAYMASGIPGLTIINIADPSNPMTEGTYNTPGYAYDVTTDGHFVYVADYNFGLRMIDVSNPANPNEIAFFRTPSQAYDVAVSGDKVLVGANSHGLCILKTFNPGETGSLDISGEGMDAAISGNYAYVAAGPDDLRVIDVSDPSNPSEVGLLEGWGDWAKGIAVSGNYAYVTVGNEGFRIVDISAPTNPIEVANFNPYWDDAMDVAVKGDYAYVVYMEGLFIVNISIPSSPTEQAFYNTGPAFGVAVRDNYVYVAADSGIYIIDVTDPANPSKVGFNNAPSTANDITLYKNYACVSVGNTSGLYIMDITDPFAPIVGGYYDTGYSQGVAVVGSYAYVATFSGGIRIIDISDPSLPVEAGYHGQSSGFNGVVASGNYAFALGGGRLEILKTYDPLQLKRYATGDNAENTAVKDNYMFVAEGNGGLRIVNISDPSKPREESFFDTPGYTWDVAVRGDYAYLADDDSLRIINITNVTQPNQVGFYDMPGSARGVVVRDNYAYVADASAGLQIIDISNPSTPIEAGSYSLDNAEDIILSDNYAYLSCGVTGFYIIDITNPFSPSETGFYNTPGFPHAIAVSGNYAYVADYLSGLRVIDISTKSNPLEIGSYDTPGQAHDVEVQGGYACVADGDSGLRIIDISQPSNPVEKGYYKTSRPAYGVKIKGAHLFISNHEDGVYICAEMIAPLSPQNLVTNGGSTSLWQSNSSFLLDWVNPDDLSGIAQAKYKTNNIPSANDDFTQIISGQPPQNATATNEGSNPLYVWLVDSAGNEDYNNNSMVSVRYDNSDPINPTAVTDISGGSQNNIWQNTSNDPNFSWQEGTDSYSGVKGYYYYWGSEIDGTSTDLIVSNAYNPVPVDTGKYYLRIKTVDNVDNSAPWFTGYIFKFDSIKPAVTAVAPSLSTSRSFNVSWDNGTDKGGSDLSGIYDVRVRNGTGEWTNWQSNYQGTSAEYIGQHGRTYYFEAAAHDSAGNIEDFTGIAECSTEVDTSYDVTAPEKPLNLVSSPDNWSNINSFTLNWENPSGDETIAGAYYKVGAVPLTPDDGTYVDGDRSEITGIQCPADGIYMVYIWLKDLKGNYSHQNADSTRLRLDTTIPILGHTPVENATVNTNINLSATASDELSGLAGFTLYYRKTGDFGNETALAIAGDPMILSANINTQRGIEYALVAQDSAGNLNRSPERGFYLIQANCEEAYNRDLAGLPVTQPRGNKVADYRIFSVPMILENNTPASVFENNLGSFDATKWKLFDVQNEQLRAYEQIKNLPIVQPGKGFLLIVNLDEEKYINVGPCITPSVSEFSKISLNAGWNLVGNPFDYNISLDSLSVSGTQPDVWYHGSNGWVSEGLTHFKKWEGLAIYSNNQTDLVIGSGAETGLKFSIVEQFKENDWGIRLQAIGETSQDIDNYIGTFGQNEAVEITVKHEPPRLNGAISLSIAPAETQSNKQTKIIPHRLSSLIQSTSIEGYHWDIELSGDITNEEVSIYFQQIGIIPFDFKKIVIDKDKKLIYDLDAIDWKLKSIIGSNKTRKFRILIGNKDYVKENSSSLDLIPQAYQLQQNFPNPFNPSTNLVFTLPKTSEVTLEVYNVLGQKISTLIDTRKYEPGYHLITWNGTNQIGEIVASGTYIFRFTAATQVLLRKGLLIR